MPTYRLRHRLADPVGWWELFDADDDAHARWRAELLLRQAVRLEPPWAARLDPVVARTRWVDGRLTRLEPGGGETRLGEVRAAVHPEPPPCDGEIWYELLGAIPSGADLLAAAGVEAPDRRVPPEFAWCVPEDHHLWASPPEVVGACRSAHTRICLRCGWHRDLDSWADEPGLNWFISYIRGEDQREYLRGLAERISSRPRGRTYGLRYASGIEELFEAEDDEAAYAHAERLLRASIDEDDLEEPTRVQGRLRRLLSRKEDGADLGLLVVIAGPRRS